MLDGIKKKLHPLADEPTIYRTIEGVEIQRFAKDVCGVRVKNVHKKVAGYWTLTAIDVERNTVTESVMLEVNSKSIPVYLVLHK